MISRLLRISFADPVLEAEFQEAQRERFCAAFRIMLLGALPLLVICLPVDLLLFPDVWPRLNALRFGVALPLTVLGLVSLRTELVRHHLNLFIPFWVSVLCVAYFLPTMLTRLPDWLQHYTPIFWVFPLLTVFLMRIRPGLATGLLIITCYFTTVAMQDVPAGVMTLQSLLVIPLFGCFVALRVLLERQSRAAFRDQALLRDEKARSENLLLNILPAPIVNRLKDSPSVIADRYEDVTVLFADIAGFTAMATRTDPELLVRHLNELFDSFDALVQQHRLEKIKTIGDAYMVAGGIPDTRTDHVVAMVEFAFAIIRATEVFSARHEETFALRIGIHTGPLVAGVIGSHKFAYDLWGDTVNTASRMETHSQPGRILVTREVVEALGDRYPFEAREPIQVKGKAQMHTFLLDEAAAGTSGEAQP